MQIFSNGTGLLQTTQRNSGGIAFVAVKVADVIYLGRAPITGISIRQGVDYSISKALNSNYLISTFGDKPVTITIQGLCGLQAICGGEDSQGSSLDFYTRYKASSKDFSRVIVSLSIIEAHVYQCAMVAMDTVGGGQKPGMVSYTLSLIGVRK